jgi:hypothetical protein
MIYGGGLAFVAYVYKLNVKVVMQMKTSSLQYAYILVKKHLWYYDKKVSKIDNFNVNMDTLCHGHKRLSRTRI